VYGYRKFLARQRAIDLVESVYRLTGEFPADERYGLTSQIRRAAVSIPANIAEGYGRAHRAEFKQHLAIARGSLLELQTHLIIAGRLELITKAQGKAIWTESEELAKILSRSIITLEKST
jgi:four helix bundle protein